MSEWEIELNPLFLNLRQIKRFVTFPTIDQRNVRHALTKMITNTNSQTQGKYIFNEWDNFPWGIHHKLFFLFWQAVFLSWVLKAIFFSRKKRKNADGVLFFIFGALASGIVFFYILWVGLWHWRISCPRRPSSLPPAWVSPSWRPSSTTSASTATPAAALPDQSLLTSLEIFDCLGDSARIEIF